MENTKNYEEKPIFEVKRRSVIHMFVCLLVIVITVPIFLMVFVEFLSIIGIMSPSDKQLSIPSFLLLGAFGLFGVYILIDILSFKKIAIYENYVLIKRNFLARDAKIKISDIDLVDTTGQALLEYITFCINVKRSLRVKIFTIFALYDEDMLEIERIVKEKIKEKKGV